jgi:glycosyltransferase involved in cell wall biosynthesis
MTRRADRLVSIITPSYNQGIYIEDAILSVKNQTYPHIEHIIVDGASTDNTLEILKRYEDVYNLRWISEPDQGQTDAVNKGFKLAQGEIIGWINSDDALFDIRTIRTVVQYFKLHDKVDVIYGDAVRIDENNLITRILKSINFNYNFLKKNCFIRQPAAFFRRTVIETFELDLRYNFAMDYDFWIRAAQNHRFQYVKDILGVDRHHANRKIVAQEAEVLEEARSISQRFGVESNTFTWLDLLRFLSPQCIMFVLNILNEVRRVNQKQYYATNLKIDNLAAFACRQLRVCVRCLKSTIKAMA